ncbi:MAG: RHS repeat-associated core domain-containing protein, partial [Planctomycetaceae bacterium]|nr:RHS repeat-associated core domain-containing protein [Planctomycetaceae bacterium]
ESGNHFIFKYDAWNRVAAVYESDGSTKVAEYFYNGLGHRITKKTYVGGILTETRNYFYNEKWQCIKERVGATIDRTYVWGTRGIDDLIMRERVEERLYPLTDPNNNVVAIIDSTGEVKERYCYDAFGKVTYLNPDFSVRITSQYDWDFLFTSRRLDKETGLMYYRNRYYHPVIGRFTSIDPLGYDAGDVNLYRYVNNQPGMLVDPMGLDVIWHGTWWYDGNRTWGDWGRGWIDWGYNTGAPVLAPPGIGEVVGGLDAVGTALQPNNIEAYLRYRRDHEEEGTPDYNYWQERLNDCQQMRNH